MRAAALSGWHALISSGTTPKLLERESQMRLIGYGGMLTESFVAVMALISGSILDQHLYFALNAPIARTGGTATSAAHYVNTLGVPGPPTTAAALTAVAAGVGVLSDALGNLGGPLTKLRNPSWCPGVWLCSLGVAAAWGSILLMGVTDPLGGINTLFPCSVSRTNYSPRSR